MDFTLGTYYPIFIYLVVVIGFAVSAVVVPHLIAPKKVTPVKQMPYESGMDPIGDARQRFDVRFYLVAILFLVFDVEIALFYPWAVVYGSPDRAVKLAALYDMLFFFGVLVVGFLYLWRFGYLDWVRASTGGRSGEMVSPPPAPRKLASV